MPGVPDAVIPMLALWLPPGQYGPLLEDALCLFGEVRQGAVAIIYALSEPEIRP